MCSGLLYPAYLTFKTLEHDRKRPDNVRGWCVYWVVCALWFAALPLLDFAFESRVALYNECKVRTPIDFTPRASPDANTDQLMD